MTDPNAHSKDSDSSGSLPPSAIAGIAIGVVLVFLLALALLVIHFRREQTRDAWDHAQYYPSHLGPPGSYSYRGTGGTMSQAHRRYYGHAFSEKPTPAAGSSGEYYDRMEAGFSRGRKINSNGSEKSESHGSSTTMHLHEGQLGRRGVSRSDGHPTPARTPSPRVPAAKIRRSNTPDSFAIQQYLQAAEDSAKLVRQPLPRSEPVAESSKSRSSLASKLPSLAMPSFSKFRPKKTNKPRISLPISTSVAAQQEYEMQISGPVNRQDTRFHDHPIGERVIYATERPPSPRPQEVYYDGYVEVPLRSGKSTLYGY